MKIAVLLSIAVVVLAAPAPQKECGINGNNGQGAGCAAGAAGNNGGNAANGTADASPQCAQIQAELAKGIQSNLDIQAQELKGIQTLQSGCTNGFAAQQQSVLDIQNQGIAIRATNQKLAAQINSPAQDGLATVAMAQVLEVSQVQSLNGTAGDAATFTKLVQEVMDGTKQNQKNLAATHSQQC